MTAVDERAVWREAPQTWLWNGETTGEMPSAKRRRTVGPELGELTHRQQTGRRPWAESSRSMVEVAVDEARYPVSGSFAEPHHELQQRRRRRCCTAVISARIASCLCAPTSSVAPSAKSVPALPIMRRLYQSLRIGLPAARGRSMRLARRVTVGLVAGTKPSRAADRRGPPGTSLR